MHTYAAARSRYLDDAVATASPAALLVMLYDRLALDLERGEAALREGRRDDAHLQLTHAQDIVAELTSTLDVAAWDGAAGLMSLYTFLASALVDANVGQDAALVAHCRELVAPLHEAWRTAAAGLAASTAATAGVA